MVQQYGGRQDRAQLVAEEGREGIVEAAAGAGTADHRPLGALARRGARSGPARISREAASAPVLFVRRGSRPGGLAPGEDVTRFTWSLAPDSV